MKVLPTVMASAARDIGLELLAFDCFSPHFQACKDRPPASDDQIQAYLFSHATWSWKFGHTSWRLGPSDFLRLNQPLPHVSRILHLYEGEAWNLSAQGQMGITLTPMQAFLRQQVRKRPVPQPVEPESVAVPPEATPAKFILVDEARIADLRRLESEKYDFSKLVALCEELNQCYRSQCYHAVAALTRAVIDHVPPVFGLASFGEVANSYAGTRPFKDCMRRPEEAARRIADAHLHTQLRGRESLPTRVQVNFSNEVDVLLGELIRISQ